jgi:hypothetical protein
VQAVVGVASPTAGFRKVIYPVVSPVVFVSDINAKRPMRHDDAEVCILS